MTPSTAGAVGAEAGSERSVQSAPGETTGDTIGPEGSRGESQEAGGQGRRTEEGEKGPTELPEVLVRGRPWRDFFETPTLESPGLTPAISTVDQTAIEQQNSYTIIEALNDLFKGVG